MISNVLPLVLTLAGAGEARWPSFRGPDASGISEGATLPESWNVETGENVRWRVPIEGLAHSSPVAWGDRVYVTSAVRKGADAELSSLFGSPGYGAGDPVEDEGAHAFVVHCLDLATGETRWKRVAFEGPPRVKRHPKSTHANPTPACDARGVVAFFGSEGLHAYDVDGELLWKRDFGVLNAGAPGMPQYEWGFASSPVIVGDRVLVQCDVQGQSFLAALDRETGETIWRTDRDEDPTWCTPAVAEVEGSLQVVANGYKRVAGYDLETGAERWWLSGGGDVPVPTPLVVDDVAYLTSAHGRSAPLTALHLAGEGELSRDPDDCEYALWNLPRRGIYMQTPLLYEGRLYACSDAGVLGCYDPWTGDELWRERLGDGTSGFSASAVAGDGKIWFTGETGDVHVLAATDDFERVARNELGELCLATPAIAGDALLFRTRGHLTAVAAPE